MAEPERLSKRNAIRQENEQRILSAAEKVFAEAGFGGATMQLIADMAGLPKANLHYYFPTKEALYREVVQNIFNIWLHAADSFDKAPGPVEGIGAYIDAKMEISRRHPDGSKVWTPILAAWSPPPAWRSPYTHEVPRNLKMPWMRCDCWQAMVSKPLTSRVGRSSTRSRMRLPAPARWDRGRRLRNRTRPRREPANHRCRGSQHCRHPPWTASGDVPSVG